jgi:hypothetical protein
MAGGVKLRAVRPRTALLTLDATAPAPMNIATALHAEATSHPSTFFPA